MLIFKVLCKTCGLTFFIKGWEEFDTNAAGLDETDLCDKGCDCLINGGEFEVLDSDYTNED